jgi:hypothetical protein
LSVPGREQEGREQVKGGGVEEGMRLICFEELRSRC